MKLTKEIRIRLAARLMAKATEKHAPGLLKRIKDLSSELEGAHLEHVKALLPEVPEKRYGQLIQEGLVTATAHAATDVYHPKREKGRLSSAHTNANRGFSKLSSPITSTEAGEIRAALRDNKAWSNLYNLLNIRKAGYDTCLRFDLDLKYSRTLPSFRDHKCVMLLNLEPEHIKGLEPVQKDYLLRVAPLYEKLRQLVSDLEGVLTAGLDYFFEVLDLLAACNTRKQLEDLFPEAAKLLPQPAPKRQDVVPVELAAKVRQRLEQGVPA